jgi:hypothetical protein
VPLSIRPSAASGPGRGGRPGSVDRRSCASGLESRVPWRGGASLADRSASSRLRVILSMRPRGPPPVAGRIPTPRGTRTRRAHESAWRVDVRESIWTPSIECQSSTVREAQARCPCPVRPGRAWSALRGQGARPNRGPRPLRSQPWRSRSGHRSVAKSRLQSRLWSVGASIAVEGRIPALSSCTRDGSSGPRRTESGRIPTISTTQLAICQEFDPIPAYARRQDKKPPILPTRTPRPGMDSA